MDKGHPRCWTIWPFHEQNCALALTGFRQSEILPKIILPKIRGRRWQLRGVIPPFAWELEGVRPNLNMAPVSPQLDTEYPQRKAWDRQKPTCRNKVAYPGS